MLEGSPEIGGKLRVAELGGLPVDVGAEAMLARRPEAITLAAEVGLGDDLEPPAVGSASIWWRDQLRPLPTGQVMGVPGDFAALAASGLLDEDGLARLELDQTLERTPIESDVAIGRYVSSRLGPQVTERLVEPLLGGVYAGHADELSFQATVPALFAAAKTERSLAQAVRNVAAAGAKRAGGPVFNGIRGGVGRLPAAVAEASGARVRTDAPVRELRRTPTGWRLVVGSAHAPEAVEADAVVLATPAPASARLLREEAPEAAGELAGVQYASMAIVAQVFRVSDLPGPLPGSGFLVPPTSGRLIKAATFSSAKWGWLAAADPDLVVIRASIGRHGEERDLQREDKDLIEAAHRDLSAALGQFGPAIDARVTRWGGALPQYAPGHVDLARRVREAVAKLGGLAICGATFDGVGIPACIATGRSAAEQVNAYLAGDGASAAAPSGTAQGGGGQ